jgi:hypothetical protein
MRAAGCTDSAQSGHTFIATSGGWRESSRINGERSRTPVRTWFSAVSQ